MRKMFTLDWDIAGDRGWVDLRIDSDQDEPLSSVFARFVERAEPLGSLSGMSFDVWLGGNCPTIASLKWGDRVSIRTSGGDSGVYCLLASQLPNPPRVELQVVDGPDVGICVPLPNGELLVGRGGTNGVCLSDPTVSSAHLRLQPTASGGLLRVGFSADSPEVWLDGKQVTGTVECAFGQRVEVGNTVFCLAKVCAPMGEPITLLRVPQPVLEADVVSISAPQAMIPPDRKRLPVASIVLPAVVGLALAIVVHPRMAVFALMSPLLMAVTFWEERRSVRALTARQQRELEAREAQFGEELTAATTRHLERCERATPSLARLIAEVRSGGPLVWAVRSNDPGAYSLEVGRGEVALPLPVDGIDGASDSAKACFDLAQTIEFAPISVTVGPGSSIGFVGPAGVDMARAQLAQLIARQGPADLRVVVYTDSDRSSGWWPLRLIGHGQVNDSDREGCVATDFDYLRRLLSRLQGATPLIVLLVDRPGSECQEDPKLQQLLAEHRMRTALLVVAEQERSLPNGCEGVFSVAYASSGICSGTFRRTSSCHTGVLPADGQIIKRVLTISPVAFRSHCWALARFLDPFAIDPNEVLARLVTFDELYGSAQWDDQVLARWSATSIRSLRAAIGKTANGPLVIDLVTDGPHALIAGTTGSGKSELLRALVLGLATEYSPENVTFLLVDFKGGSAFGELRELPHVVGLVTDLDGRLAERTLISLNAELRRREGLLREAGVSDLSDYAASGVEGVLPRLVVVIDEFATLAKELPAFIGALIDVAQRGRSLGIHLVLATQRPSGVVNDNIRANTNIRICLRVQSAADSHEVLGVASASTIEPALPGRALLRNGSAPAIEFQSSLVGSKRADRSVNISVISGHRAWLDLSGSAEEGHTEKEVQVLDSKHLANISRSFRATGRPLPRRPLQDPLPVLLPYVAGGSQAVSGVGLIDDPERQALRPLDVRIEDENVVLVGSAKSGKTAAIRSILLNAMERCGQHSPHVYVVSFQPSQFAQLAESNLVGAVIDGDDRERQARLWSTLAKESARRRAGDRPARSVVVVVDGYSLLRARSEDALGMQLLDQLHRVILEGPSVGITCLLSTDRWAGLPGQVASGFNRRLVLRLNDTTDWMTLGVRPTDIPDPTPGRILDTLSGLCGQFAFASDEIVGEVVAASNDSLGGSENANASPVHRLPTLVLTSALDVRPSLVSGALTVPLGLSGDDLVPELVSIQGGESFLITGPARSGKTSLVAVIVEAFREATTQNGIEGRVFGLSARPIRWEANYDVDWVASVPDLISALNGVGVTAPVSWNGQPDSGPSSDLVKEAEFPTLVVIDDAEFLEDPSSALARLVAERRANLWIVAAGRADILRSSYSHWTVAVRKSRKGFALRPNVDSDGDLWLTALPRRSVVDFVSGRGYLVSDGEAVLVQAAMLGD